MTLWKAKSEKNGKKLICDKGAHAENYKRQDGEHFRDYNFKVKCNAFFLEKSCKELK